MVKLEDIRRFGDGLRESKRTHITTDELYLLLRRATGTITRPHVKNYLLILKDEKYIKFTSFGNWEILRP